MALTCSSALNYPHQQFFPTNKFPNKYGGEPKNYNLIIEFGSAYGRVYGRGLGCRFGRSFGGAFGSYFGSQRRNYKKSIEFGSIFGSIFGRSNKNTERFINTGC
ncbi:hypothetical protein AKJ58_00190 [candidate division MSBL1 archaeon SCGC-AAA385D11]|uniref:Uncharacterized protein n=1 Tax=candidate division MSBL1 archaeon SCGC-AAA385D11 TaxID=1698286 RepID=A0A133VPN1_9EURY|nr:hypothetical protein AKJ58_00190 [candidate division MSBL1 archaeon SCGC-AAA385D11]